MAISEFSEATNIIASLPDDPNDSGGLTAAQLKAKFDENAANIKAYLNDTLIAGLNSTAAGSSGADNLGYGGDIPGVFDVGEALSLIYSAGSGSIPPDSTITAAKITDEAVTPEKLDDNVRRRLGILSYNAYLAYGGGYGGGLGMVRDALDSDSQDTVNGGDAIVDTINGALYSALAEQNADYTTAHNSNNEVLDQSAGEVAGFAIATGETYITAISVYAAGVGGWRTLNTDIYKLANDGNINNSAAALELSCPNKTAQGGGVIDIPVALYKTWDDGMTVPGLVIGFSSPMGGDINLYGNANAGTQYKAYLDDDAWENALLGNQMNLSVLGITNAAEKQYVSLVKDMKAAGRYFDLYLKNTDGLLVTPYISYSNSEDGSTAFHALAQDESWPVPGEYKYSIAADAAYRYIRVKLVFPASAVNGYVSEYGVVGY